MKITAQEEFGLRILIRIARNHAEGGMSIPQLSKAEGLSNHYVAKLTRVLRMEGFIASTPGNKGGYVLAKPARDIPISQVVKGLGGALFSKDFCGTHSGVLKLCANSVDCSARSLWLMVQYTVDKLLGQITLHDLANPEKDSSKILLQILEHGTRETEPSLS